MKITNTEYLGMLNLLKKEENKTLLMGTILMASGLTIIIVSIISTITIIITPNVFGSSLWKSSLFIIAGLGMTGILLIISGIRQLQKNKQAEDLTKKCKRMREQDRSKITDNYSFDEMMAYLYLD